MTDPRKACRRKHAYPSYEEAEAARQRYLRVQVDGLVVYQCIVCWSWHLGHLTERHQASER